MPRRVIALAPEEYYHLYNRGNNRGRIVFEPSNYVFFLRQLRQYVLPAVELVAYCLMPTHYHLLVHLKTVDLAHRMQLFSISYTKACNKSYGRTGALFQGAFQAKHIASTEHLLHLSRYIHVNPVVAGLAQKPEEWEYSSYRDYVGIRQGTLPSPAIVLEQFASAAAYRKFTDAYTPAQNHIIQEALFDEK